MITYHADTVPQLLRRGADSAPAIGTPGRPWLTHAGLRALAQRTTTSLNAMGIGRNDRVAMVVPNGPEMAAAFVAIACAAPRPAHNSWLSQRGRLRGSTGGERRWSGRVPEGRRPETVNQLIQIDDLTEA